MKPQAVFASILGVLTCVCHSQTVDFTKSYEGQLRQIAKSSFSIEVFEKGKLISSKENLSGGKVATVLQKLLETKKDSWKESGLVTYVPELVFTTTGMSLNVTGGLMVLNLALAEGKWRQYVSSSNPEILKSTLKVLE